MVSRLLIMETKLTFEDIPEVGSPSRAILITKLTELDIYKDALKKNAALGFSTEELDSIENKYKKQGGMFNEDIQNEINKKGWLLKPTTIKQYIQKGQLPMPKGRQAKGKGAVSLYPLNFMRHLNLVRFLFNTGKEMWLKIKEHLPPANDYELLQKHYPFDSYDYDVFLYLKGNLSLAIDDGIRGLSQAIESAYQDNSVDGSVKTRLEKYRMYLKDIGNLIEDLLKKAESFEEETKKHTF